ncbi:hypothetical protein JZ751_019734 [Albula glossodonta]|uniref:Ig-like domain-containing protein n=1 Tax=Albula glossodonta TaxID=121402 RepID=A0A8T2MYS8_9TELE|nr:hypothetical protein JZ751_019734 [Albula glossodonta]
MDCTFDINRSNYNWFYWYRQYPGSAPQYILCRGSGSGTADFAKDRFESTADENSGKTVLTIKKLIPEDSAMYYCALRTSAHSVKDTKHVNLEISSAKVTDSALYYCALQPTVTGNP